MYNCWACLAESMCHQLRGQVHVMLLSGWDANFVPLQKLMRHDVSKQPQRLDTSGLSGQMMQHLGAPSDVCFSSIVAYAHMRSGGKLAFFWLWYISSLNAKGGPK